MAGRKRHLFLAFDAFGTLFQPSRPVYEQYGSVAESYGLKNLALNEIDASFRKAYKHEAAQHPNYGKAAGLSPTKWWSNIITNTFTPLLGEHQKLPAGLVPKLLERFASAKGYALTNGTEQMFQSLRSYKNADLKSPWGRWDSIVVAAISNSDDRIITVLQSLGLRVQERRFDATSSGESRTTPPISTADDISYVILSYDVGHEKPDKRIFDAARGMLAKDLEQGRHGIPSAKPLSVEDFEFLLVGDDIQKDVFGASDAGWHAILFDTQGVPAPALSIDRDGPSVTVPRIDILTLLAYWSPP